MAILKILANISNLLFVAAILLGLYWPQAASVAYILVLPALMMTHTLTLLRFPGGFFKKPRELLGGALWGSLMNYLVLSNLIILGSIFLVRDEKFWIGLVLIAAVPAAVAILPLGEKIRSDNLMTMAGFAGTYIGAVILAPLIGVAFLKYIPIHYDKLIILAVTLVIMPLILSRIAVDRNWDIVIRNREGMISDICFFVIFYALTASNAYLIRQWSMEMMLISAVALATIVVPAIGLIIISRFYRVSRANISSLMLLGTMKNCGLAGGIALYLFYPEAALPALIFGVFRFLNTIWMKFRGLYYSL